MRLFHGMAARLRSLLHGRQVDAGVAEELRLHVERETEANVARGMTPADAYRAARLAVGSVDAAMETTRDERPGAGFRVMMRDAMHGVRLLGRAPVFGIAAVTIVALGIAAVTTIFSVVHGVMLRPLPFAEPDRLVRVWISGAADGARLLPAAADVADWRRSNRVFSSIAMVRTTANFNITGGGEPERLQGARVSPNLFGLLGVPAAIGRTFTADEAEDGRDRVVLLSDGLWRRRFAADDGVVGRTISLNGTPHVVIGVMPRDFQYPSRDYQVWAPLTLDPLELTRQRTQNYLVVGRLRDGSTVAQAQSDLGAITRRATMSAGAARGVVVEPLLDGIVRDVRPALIALIAAASCLLVIACLNLSNLLGARAASRAREFALRLALGASRRRLLAQVLAEIAPLLAAGGVAGIVVAAASVRLFVAMAPAGMPRLESVTISLPVVLLSLIALVVTGIVASIMPTRQAWRADFVAMAGGGTRSATVGRDQARARRFGVAAQIAVAVPLLVGGAVLVRSALALSKVDLGFEAPRVLTLHVAVPRAKYPADSQVAGFYRRMLAGVAAVPGVTYAGMVNRLPLAGNQTMTISARRSTGELVEISAVDSRPVTPQYFKAMGIALRGGRAFTEEDDAAGAPVAIVDDQIAAAMWPGQDPVGQQIKRFDGKMCMVVGLVAHIRSITVDTDPRPQVYWSYRQVTQDRMVLVVRTARPPEAMVGEITRAIHDVDADQPVYDVRTMDAVVDRSLAQRRITMSLIGAFALMALALAAVGIYGVVAYRVTTRLREFGIRVALGATRGDVSRMVLGEGLGLALAGVSVGTVGAVMLSRAMQSLVFGVSALDPASVAAGAGVLLGVAVVASYVPSRRASAVDPAITLRAE